MGRLHHLKETVPHALAVLRPWWPAVELNIVDYNSSDGMSDWLHRSFPTEIEYGLLRLVRTVEPRFFRMSHAKNVAHLSSTGSILFNLDADNFIDEPLIPFLFREFRRNPDVVLRGREYFGFGGRIAITRLNFLRLGGYNECFRGWGEDDLDLLNRAKRLGLEVKTMRSFDRCLDHGNDERKTNLPPGSFLDVRRFDMKYFSQFHPLALNPELGGSWLLNFLIRESGVGCVGPRANAFIDWGYLDPRRFSSSVAPKRPLALSKSSPQYLAEGVYRRGAYA
jgi:glycosyltransferase involved in cell wall biosynthesis